MDLSIVVPVFNEPIDNIEELRFRINKVCCDRKYNYELIFVDDGSSNGISDFLKRLPFEDERIKLIAFSKNYGQMNALAAGVYSAKGDVVITMDADLQYLPEEIPLFMVKISQGYDFVGGRRPKKSIRLLSKILTCFSNVVVKAKFNDYGCIYYALKRGMADSLSRNGFTLPIKPILIKLAKKTIEIGVTYDQRKYGNSQYSFMKYMCYGIKCIYSFLKWPYLSKN